MAKVLIIEDDDVIAQGMARHLTVAGFDALGVANGETGLARLRYEQPDVCVLDLMLPGVDGWKLIEQARGEGIGTPIVVVSARGTEHDRDPRARARRRRLPRQAVLDEGVGRARRCGRAARHARAGAAARRGDRDRGAAARPAQRAGLRDGASAELTPTEFRLLYALALDQGRVLTRDELLQRVWGRRASHRDRTVDVFVRKLREKVDERAPGTRSSRRATASATSSTRAEVASSPPAVSEGLSPRNVQKSGVVCRRSSGYRGRVLTLYQAEWCPNSRRVRQRLTSRAAVRRDAGRAAA